MSRLVPRTFRCGGVGVLAAALLLTWTPTAARAASVFLRPFTGNFTITSASTLDATGIRPRPEFVGEVLPVKITITDKGGGTFDAQFQVNPVEGTILPGRTTASSLNGNNISWSFTSTGNNTDIDREDVAAKLVLDQPHDAYSMSGTLTDTFLVSTLPPGNFSFFDVASGTFTAAQAPTGVPLPPGAWAGATALLPLCAFRRKVAAILFA